MAELYDTASSRRVGHTVLGGGSRSHIFHSLNPGTHYSVAVRATAGPYHASTPNLTHCTREYSALLAAVSSTIPSLIQRPFCLLLPPT